jgi:hypothetical protein
MKKTLENILYPVVGMGIVASLYVGAQFGMFKLMENNIRKTEAKHGVSYAVKASVNTLQDTSNPMQWLVLPGYRVAIINYIDKHK